MRQHIKRFSILVVALVLAGGVVLRPGTEALVPGVNELVSQSTGSTLGNNTTYTPEISGDGKFVAFRSSASNLVSGDTNGANDIFLRDIEQETTIRVSVSSLGVEANGASAAPRISHDGKYVVYSSAASNLVSDDTNGYADAFVYNRMDGTTTRITVNTSGAEANNNSGQPDISADGRFVVFESSASNLVSGVNPYGGGTQVFMKDMLTNAVQALSIKSNGARGNGASSSPQISCDGGVVVFSSQATDLVSGDTNGAIDVYLSVIGWSKNTLHNVTKDHSTGSSYSGDISCDGNTVAFSSVGTGFIPEDTNAAYDVYTYDRIKGEYEWISTRATLNLFKTAESPRISGDGRFVSFGSNELGLDANRAKQVSQSTTIYIRDRREGTTQGVAINTSNKLAQTYGTESSISNNGEFIAYSESTGSAHPPLLAIDTNGKIDGYISKTGF